MEGRQPSETRPRARRGKPSPPGRPKGPAGTTKEKATPMPNTTPTDTAAAVEIPGETVGDVLDLAEILRIHCDDPRGIRAELDDFAGRIYRDADGIAADPWHANLRHLANAAWSLVTELDRLRDEADALHAALRD